MKTTKFGARMIRDEMFVFLGMVLGMIAVILWADTAKSATFQPIPNGAFGIHWGMSIEEASKVRSLELVDEVDKFKLYLDTSITDEDPSGIIMVMYLSMDDRMAAVFLRSHCEQCFGALLQAFVIMHGPPTYMDQQSLIVEWKSGGNVIRIRANEMMTTIGNSKILEMSDEAFAKEMKKREMNPENDGPMSMPGPKTES